MSIAVVIVLLGGLLLTALAGWYLFGQTRSRLADLDDRVQVVRVVEVEFLATGHDEEPGDGTLAESATATDPVCGMTVDVATATTITAPPGFGYYFCSQHCADSFTAEPERYRSTPSTRDVDLQARTEVSR